MSHDWPNGAARRGDTAALIRRKRFFAAEINGGRLGSSWLEGLIGELRPRRWFSAHLHVAFAAKYQWGRSQAGKWMTRDLEKRKKEQGLGVAVAEAERAARARRSVGAISTKFLALDKALPGRHFFTNCQHLRAVRTY